MRRTCLLATVTLLVLTSISPAQTVRLKATADVCLSNQPTKEKDERLSSMGLSDRFKLKSVQEMAAIRFDAAPAAGRQVKRAALFLRRLPGPDMMRHVRVSTVNQDWEEGKTKENYGPPSGACFLFADYDTKRPWAWADSCFADVVMTSGNSLGCFAERKDLPDRWVSVELAPELVYALAAGDSDGLAVCDAGNLTYFNNLIHSVQAGADSAPYIEVELGEKLETPPGAPAVKAEPAPDKSRPGSGAIRVTIATANDVFCWKLKLDGKPVDRWRVKHPPTLPLGVVRGDSVQAIEANRSFDKARVAAATTFAIEDLTPGKEYELEAVAVAAGGKASPPVKLKVTASPALDLSLRLPELKPPMGVAMTAPEAPKGFRVCVVPPLVKVSPEKMQVLSGDMEAAGLGGPNSVFDGQGIVLAGARGEYVSFQLVVERLGEQPLKDVRVDVTPPAGPDGAKLVPGDIELYQAWYAQNGRKEWQPSYCVPFKDAPVAGQAASTGKFDIPDPRRKLETQRTQTVYVDVYVPKGAKPGEYKGEVLVAAGAEPVKFPLKLTVYDFELPDKLAFWPQLNTYGRPANWHSYFKLAHQHRNVFYYRSLAPKTTGAGKDLKIDWTEYDKLYAPILSGELFKDNRRAGVPVESIALPFQDSWPTNLTTETYAYKGDWPKKGDKVDGLNEHYMTCPPIEQGLSQEYKDAYLAATRQFIEHFRQKGWNQTESQCVFVGKNTHRTQFGINMWWTTDEPYHWVDWLALQYFDRLFVRGRGDASPRLWSTRADISRPLWQGMVLAGATDTVYIGGFSGEGQFRRCQWLAENSPMELRAYGGANSDAASNHGSLVMILNCWLNGASAALPWQTLGSDAALDKGDPPGGGYAMICPGERFGTGAVADYRLKAFRDGEQLVEYLNILAERRKLSRAQLRHLVVSGIGLTTTLRAGASADNADAMSFGTLKDWQLQQLRAAIAKLIVEK